MKGEPRNQTYRRIELSRYNRILRILWSLVWFFLYRPSPRIFHGWRRLLLNIFGAKVSKGAHPYPSARIWAPWNLEMAEGSCIGDFVDVYSVDKISIGSGATVSQYSYLCTASHDYTDNDMPLIAAPIFIGEKAWITADVFVAPGVTINRGAVVTARSSVFKDVPSWTVASGNPASAIRKRETF